MSEPFSPRTTRLIGRNQFVEEIKSAIEGDDECCVIYLTGVGGIGKTRLLEEVAVMASENDRRPFCWSGIIDLYHAQNHSVEEIELAVVEGLDPERRFFALYRQEREHYVQLRSEDVTITGSMLEKAWSKLHKAFTDDYAAIAEQYRIVLTFDSLELMHYEHDLGQSLCKADDELSLIKNWFVANVGKLPNTVTLFAGRARPRVLENFTKAFGTSCQFLHLHVPGLDEDEVDQYLQDILSQRDIDDNLSKTLQETELRSQLKRLASAEEKQGGDGQIGVRPIFLSLLLDLLEQ